MCVYIRITCNVLQANLSVITAKCLHHFVLIVTVIEKNRFTFIMFLREGLFSHFDRFHFYELDYSRTLFPSYSRFAF